MGEYEPDDSRKVTLTPGGAPGEPPRTGPREAGARRQADDKPDDQTDDQAHGRREPGQSGRMDQPRQQAAQSQNQRGGGQSQQQSQPGSGSENASKATAPGDPDRQEMQAEPGGPLAGDQPQAIDNPAGAARPSYDQYELNHPQNMHRQSAEHVANVREQAGRQEDAVAGERIREAGQSEGHPPAESRSADEAAADDERPAPDAAHRGYGGRGEAAAESGEEP